VTQLQKFFTIPYIKFTIHLVIVVGLFLNIFYLYDYWSANKSISNQRTILDTVIQQSNELKSEQSYFSSDIYREKYSKELNFKNRGEKVVDTSVIESLDSKVPPVYIPEKNKKQPSNMEKWIVCLFGESVEKTSYSNLNTICR
jgi:hypothetical protein